MSRLVPKGVPAQAPLLDVAELRLRIQGITAPRFSTPAETVGWFGAMQAQEYAYAKWSIGKRAPGIDEAAVDRALAEGTILRTHVLRPTWHYVRPEDLRWLQGATAHRVLSMMASYDRALELDAALYSRTNDLIAREVEGGRHRTRAELGDALAGSGIAAKGQRLAHIVLRAELDAIVCSGTPRDKATTYALVAERAPAGLSLDGDEALAELTRRYFISHGPATEKDFRWWSSLTAGEARRGLELVSGELERRELAGRTYWWYPQDPPASVKPGAAHLLQAYDEAAVAYTESRGVLGVANLAGMAAGEPAFQHLLLVAGQLAGKWRRQLRDGQVRIEVQLLRSLRGAEKRAIAEEVERYGRFTGMDAEIVW